MGFPAQLDNEDQHFPDDDSVSHFAARELQIILRIGVVISIVATALTMATFWFFAWIPLIVLVGSIIGLLVINGIEQRTRDELMSRRAEEHQRRMAQELAPDADTPAEAQLLARDEEHFIPMRLLRKAGIMGLEIIVGLALAAVALVLLGLATGRLPWELVFIATGLFVVYGLLVMAPVWLGWFTDVDAEAKGKVSNEHVKRA